MTNTQTLTEFPMHGEGIVEGGQTFSSRLPAGFINLAKPIDTEVFVRRVFETSKD